jgi:hypothetical protein
VGIDRSKMKLYDCEQSAQENILDTKDEEFDHAEHNQNIFSKFDKFSSLKV